MVFVKGVVHAKKAETPETEIVESVEAETPETVEEVKAPVLDVTPAVVLEKVKEAILSNRELVAEMRKNPKPCHCGNPLAKTWDYTK